MPAHRPGLEQRPPGAGRATASVGSGQTPEFHEYTLVLEGELTVRTIETTFNVKAGQSIITYPGEWVKYETKKEGANYIAICLPAFSQEKVNRDE